MHIREVGNNDLGAVAVLLEEFCGRTVTTESVGDNFAKILQDDNRTIIIVEEDGAILGVVVINLVFRLLKKPEARIDEIVVAGSAQGKGYGTMLMKACEEWAWSREAGNIELTSRPSRQAANALYQKLDYTIRETNVYNKKRVN